MFKDWYEKSQYVVCLSVPDENHLERLYEKLKWRGADVVAFHEPDIDNQMTAICYYGTPEMRKITNKLKLEIMKDEKWLMFKNYMHNELGITKEDIRQWIDDSVREQAERMVKNEFDSFDVKNIVKRLIFDDKYFGSDSMRREVTNELSKQLLEKFDFKKE